jgi:DnaJ-class molecular chaperone
LFIVANVSEHTYFKRQGDNIYCTVPITVPEAALGSKIEVPTVDGKALLRIPPGTQSGQRFRLRERGVPSLRAGGIRGDHFVEVKITLPKVISEETKEILQEFARHNRENPRAEMGV